MTMSKRNTFLRRAAAVAFAATLGAGLAVAGSTAASANATGGRGCDNGSQVVGHYFTSGGARSAELGGDCGTVSVRAAYRTYSGAPTYYTSWKYGSSTAIQSNPGNTQLFSNHNGTRMNGDLHFTLQDP